MSSRLADGLPIRSAIDRALERNDVRTAKALVDAHYGDREYGNCLPLARADLLARSGDEAGSLDLYLATLRDPKMHWSPDSRGLGAPFELALALRRRDDADQLATRMIAHPCAQFYEGVVSTPRSAETEKARLAYADLLIAIDEFDGPNPEHRVRYARMAQRLLPNSVPVLAQLADALHHRRKPGDQEETAALLKHAYAVLPGDSVDRRTVRIFASDKQVVVDPKADVQKDLAAMMTEAQAQQRRDRLADEERRRAQRLGMGP